MSRSLTLFVLFLVTEIAIALFHFHKFVRGFVGDVLLIPLLFYFCRLFLKWKTWVLQDMILGLAITIEIIQVFHIHTLFNIESVWLKTILGTTFDPYDLLAYGLGGLLILFIQKFNSHEHH